MPRKILGYPITANWRVNKPQVLELPICGASILSVELVDGNFVLYVAHDPVDESPKMRKLVLFKAGQDVDPYMNDYSFVGTMVNGPWAWHVFIGLDCIDEGNEPKVKKDK